MLNSKLENETNLVFQLPDVRTKATNKTLKRKG